MFCLFFDKNLLKNLEKNLEKIDHSFNTFLASQIRQTPLEPVD